MLWHKKGCGTGLHCAYQGLVYEIQPTVWGKKRHRQAAFFVPFSPCLLFLILLTP